MDYQHLAYPDLRPSQYYLADPRLNPTVGEMIDPNLEDSNTPPQGMIPWNTQVSRFTSNHNETAYFGHTYLDSNFVHDGIRQGDAILPFPSALLHRQESPSDHSSSICSNAHSPPGESEYGLDHLPCTPPDVMSVLNHSEAWGSQSQVYLTGLTHACVKLDDVNPFQDSFPGYGEDRSPQLLPRGFSMSSNGSSYGVDQSQPEQFHPPRQTSPIELREEIKDEICIPDNTKAEYYLSLASDDEQSPSEDGFELSQPTFKEEEDEDYTPQKSYKRTSSNANHNVKTRKRSSSSPGLPAKKIKSQSGSYLSNHRPPTKSVLHGPKGGFPCSECRDVSFRDEGGLQKHIKQQHTRPFICIFHWAGCESTFASKNEWKRHVSSQHLLLNYWLCQQHPCTNLPNVAASPEATSRPRGRPSSSVDGHDHNGTALPNGAIFNRKDLYTQHLRRMHIPPHIRKQVKQKKTVSEWEERIRVHQDEARRLRCELPDHMTCPAHGCNTQFDGKAAWDDRMEHVAKHLEKAATGSESPVSFGGDHDSTLTDWAARPEVAIVKRDDRGRWRLNNPLKPEKNVRSSTVLSEDEDAEGEDVDD